MKINKMKLALRACPICERKHVDVLHTLRFELIEGHPLSSGYDLVSCINCGFVYADTAATQADYDLLYREHSKYEDATTATGGITNLFDRTRQQDTARKVASFLNSPADRVLDVGCANGGMLRALRELGYTHLLGIDPSPNCVENTRRLGIDAQLGSLFAPPPGGGFDCLILSHTLEHILDLKVAAEWIKAAMKEDAYLYVEVPDASRYVDFVDSPLQDFNTEHINHFSTIALKNFMKRNGLRPVECGEKVIAASANKPYPAIYCIAQKGQIQGVLETDRFLRPKIEAYIIRSQEILNEMESRLRHALSESKRILVWGTGQLTMKLLVETSLATAEIVAFVDSNPINQGKKLYGRKVISPAEVIQFSEPILIASTLHQQSIEGQIRQMHLKNSLIFL